LQAAAFLQAERRYDRHAITYRAAAVLNAVIAWTRH
jgi:hypothetical protein